MFLGIIKDGYGAGKLSKWDDGKCVIHKYSPSHIIIEFKGKKIKGIYHLINTGVFNKKDFKKQQYILFKGSVVKEAKSIWGPEYDPENFDKKSVDAKGMRSALFFPDSETDEETSDLQQTEPLKWSVSKPKRIVAAEQLYEMLKRYKK